MLREFVVNLLGTEVGADDVLRQAWARLEAMETLPPRKNAKLMMLTLAEQEAGQLRQKTTLEPAPLPAAPVDDPGERQPGSGDLGG